MATTTQAKQAAQKTADEAELSLKEVSVQLEALKSDIANLTSAMSEYGKGRVREAKSSAEGYARTARETAEERVERLQAEAERYGREARDFVHQQPGSALGIAAILGFIVGLFAARK
ncbi:DUF883 family protein [Oceanicola granulosus]|nr:DUF883 family protein [Oceanicola granulosus]